MNRNPMIAAVVLVEHAGRMLLIQEAKASCRGKWFFPGGRIESGESIVDTALREAREESGLEVELRGLLYVDHLLEAPFEGNVDRVRFVFVARPVGGELKREADEHSLTANWFSISEIERLDTRSPFVEKMIALYQRGPGLLPISSFHVLSPEDRKQERP